MRAKDVRVRHMKGCMEEGYRIESRGKNKGKKIYASAGTKSRMKSLFNLMFDYALEYEIVDTNYARHFEISDDIIKEIKENHRPHIPFTDDELQKLWDNIGKIEFADETKLEELGVTYETIAATSESSFVRTNFEIGKLLFEAQGGEKRAKYGNSLINN